jgi:hypothetical protein
MSLAPAVVKSVDMPEDLQEDAVRTILDALDKFSLEKVRDVFPDYDFSS